MWTFAPGSQRIDISASLLVDVHVATARSSSTTTFMIMNALGLSLRPLLLPFCEEVGTLVRSSSPAVV